MLAPLRSRTYRHLFAAQVISLIGTGLATIALGLLAYKLAGSDAGIVLGSALAIIVLMLPFVDQVWQVYLRIFVLQSASAAFTPTFQATIPDILTDEREYTVALSLSRLAYDLENLLSPMLAALLLTVISVHWLFAGTAIGFIISALFVVSVGLPQAAGGGQPASIYERTTRGAERFKVRL